MDTLFHHQLFDLSKQVTPYLSGSIAPASKGQISLSVNLSDAIGALYCDISRSNEEAGKGYWMTRCWECVIWQPVYLAFISIYALKGLPQLTTLSQKVQSSSVYGFHFPSHQHIHGEHEQLIKIAGKQLDQLFSVYLQQMNNHVRIRPGYANHLLADLILSCLVKLQQGLALQQNHTVVQDQHSSSQNDYFQQQAQLWFEALQLPTTLLRGLKSNNPDRLELIRTSCCLVYRCEQGTLCDNCPRNHA
ncbi:siderophore ferric iron reductase [Vibrio sp. MA40-2]|uniref:siderophore ferric iron reductase n=1 Tax=Vibrio sp. MA40-2 TaxID=3391828 RepID=UPI0039A4669C